MAADDSGGLCDFALGFDLFLEPHSINCGGLSGLAQVVLELLGRIFPQAELEQALTVGRLTAIMNVPLFILGGTKIGKRFFAGSLVGMLAMSGCLDLIQQHSGSRTEPLLGALYGGLVTGFAWDWCFCPACPPAARILLCGWCGCGTGICPSAKLACVWMAWWWF